MSFPRTRLRRLRESENVRRLVSEVSLSTDDFLYPVFVKEGINRKEKIEALPGQFRYPLGKLEEIIEKCENIRIPGVLLFGIPKKKDRGSSAYKHGGVVQEAIREIKDSSSLAVFSDVCLCQYTSSGECGILENGEVDNDKTLEILKKIAISHAESGADFVAPSAMMDGQVKAIRDALDGEGFQDTGIMSYSVKFHSSFYSPFREAVQTSGGKFHREMHQMDFKCKQILREVELDLEEGTDIVMVKPALPYLDVISKIRSKFDVPLAAYQVSGEYSSLKNLSMEAVIESLFAIKRAGANFIISYASLEAGEWLNDHRNKGK